MGHGGGNRQAHPKALRRARDNAGMAEGDIAAPLTLRRRFTGEKQKSAFLPNRKEHERVDKGKTDKAGVLLDASLF